MESDSSVFIYIFNGLLGKKVPWVYTARGFLFLPCTRTGTPLIIIEYRKFCDLAPLDKCPLSTGKKIPQEFLTWY